MCEFFKWHDGVMGFRATEVIMELMGTVERLEGELVAARAELGKKNKGIMRIQKLKLINYMYFERSHKMKRETL